MATIAVFIFDPPDGAEKMLPLVQGLTKAQLVTESTFNLGGRYE